MKTALFFLVIIAALGIIIYANRYYRSNDQYSQFLEAQANARQASEQLAQKTDADLMAASIEKVASTLKQKPKFYPLILQPPPYHYYRKSVDLLDAVNSHWYTENSGDQRH